MALNLVAYDSSDNESNSEVEDSTSDKGQVVIVPRQPATVTISSVQYEEDETDIPRPSEKELEIGEIAKREKSNLAKVNPLQKLAQKKNGKILIGIPSLADFEDDEKEERKNKSTLPVAPNKGRSKLFSTIPLPKNSSYGSPTEDNIKPPSSSVSVKKSTPLIPQAVMRREAKKDSDDEEDASSNFFSMNEPALPEIQEPVHIQSNHQPNQEIVSYTVAANQMYNLANVANSNITQPRQSDEMELNEVALEALQGTSGLKRKLPEDAQIIDIKQERLTYDPSMSYIKAVSEEKNLSSGEEFTYNKLQKKKHQITWLAAQAKAREVDLKNQWAANKASRKQTQAKYGF